MSYSDPVVIYDSKKTRIVFVPFFITHTNETELAGKIITYRKADPPAAWLRVEEKSLSLDGRTLLKLLGALRRHAAVAEKNADGTYLAIPLSGGASNLAQHDPAQVAQALMKVLATPEVAEHIGDADLGSELRSALRNAVRMSEMRSALAKLRQLLDGGEVREDVYQDWCDAHSWAFGNAYVLRDKIRNISASDRVDLLLPVVTSGLRDVVELKRPDSVVLHYDDGHRNYYFAADVAKALGQCNRYLDVLHEVAAKGLLDHPEIVAYHPRATIVIGRSNGWKAEQLHALHGLNSRMTGITVMTYDQLLSQGERLLEMFAAHEGAVEPDATSLEVFDPDEIPF